MVMVYLGEMKFRKVSSAPARSGISTPYSRSLGIPVAPPTMYRKWICVVSSSVRLSVPIPPARSLVTQSLIICCEFTPAVTATLYSTTALVLEFLRYLNSVKLTSAPTSSTNRLNDPFSSGITLTSVASCFNPPSASCDTTRSRSKFMLAPDAIATTFPLKPFASQYALAPATATAPAGSKMDRFSSNTSLIAAHIWSVLTVMTPSTSCWHRSKHTAPGCRTATPSANPSTLVRRHSSPWYSDCTMALAPSGSTPITLMSGRMDLTYAAMPAMSPPPPTGTKMASTPGSCRRISMPTVP
mmetsp:Transcript_6086/g.15510  ORF Transcript_6086/g.15510 Transcript_6086/m.15510 type:complete len:299 (+) Transcript_6086:433-1329(+)